jgi:cell division protease FtsH
MPKNTKPKQTPPAGSGWRNLIWFTLIALAAISFFISNSKSQKPAEQIEFSKFVATLQQGDVSEVVVQPTERLITGKTKEGKEFKAYYLDYPTLISDLNSHGVKVSVNPNNTGWVWSAVLQAFLPFILIALLWFFIFRQTQGANNQAMSFGKSRATPWKKDKDNVITFKDVAGADEAVEEVQEIVDFLKSPKKYLDIGAKIPKGVLLMGPPGTGKTLLAKAIAGEANVPFFSISGSDFVEMFVGVGASRVRDLFGQAKKNTPCIIFVDEIDAVGRHRGAGVGGGHDEREQTLNQLLVEMDGFEPTQTVIVIAATNRPDILDPALLRPGRFDRQIVVDKPDVKGRFDILKIHAKSKKVAKNVDLNVVAKRTPGFTGADLSNLVNESALLAARKGLKSVSMVELEEATDRVMAGPQRKSRIMVEREREIVAYHEVGHAIVAHCIPNSDPVHKVSILPRGMALGYTLQLPVDDRHLISRQEMKNQIQILMGGRIAEELRFNEITSGASNDIERATDLARNYVCKYGMSQRMGVRKYGKAQSQVFLGRDYSDHSKDYSESTAHEIDNEIKSLITECYDDATKILTRERAKLEDISKILIKKEVLEADQFSLLMAAEKADISLLDTPSDASSNDASSSPPIGA